MAARAGRGKAKLVKWFLRAALALKGMAGAQDPELRRASAPSFGVELKSANKIVSLEEA